MKKVALVANTASFLLDNRLPFIQFLRGGGYEPVLVCRADQAEKRLLELGFPVWSSRIASRSLRFWQAPVRFLRLCWIFLRTRPDIVHCHTLRGVWSVFLASRISGARSLVVSLEGLECRLDSSSFPGRVRAVFLKVILRRLAQHEYVHFLFENPDELAAFDKVAKVAPARFSLVRGLGVDLKRFQPPKSERVTVDGQPTRILFGQRLRRGSGLEDLRQACAIMRARKVDFELFVSGLPDEEDPEFYTAEELRAWQKEGWLRLVGQVESMDSLLRSAEIAVFPSARPGRPRFLIEAAASGRAIVAGDLPGPREVVAHEQSGVLFRAGEPPALARALERLIRDSDLRSQVGKGARQVAEALFADDFIHEKTKNIYDSLSQA